MTDMTASVHFSIKYDGPALAQHQMDVRELAPALIALAGLLENANKSAFPEAPEVQVNVQGFKGGSFGIDLAAVQTIAERVVSLLSGREATAAANLLALLTGLGIIGRGGVIGVIKWLKGRKPSSIRFHGDSAVFELVETETIETFEVDIAAGKLYQSRVVRQSLAKVIKPLEREGIDYFAAGRDGRTEVLVTKDEARYFEMAASDADIVSDTVAERVLLQVDSAVFKEANKWRLNDGAASFFAEISDGDFLARIESGEERFGKGDVLVADLRRIQSVTDNGLKLEYSVVKVHEHREPLQMRIGE
jgi:hypothetical protein